MTILVASIHENAEDDESMMQSHVLKFVPARLPAGSYSYKDTLSR